MTNWVNDQPHRIRVVRIQIEKMTYLTRRPDNFPSCTTCLEGTLNKCINTLHKLTIIHFNVKAFNTSR